MNNERKCDENGMWLDRDTKRDLDFLIGVFNFDGSRKAFRPVSGGNAKRTAGSAAVQSGKHGKVDG